VPALAGTRSAPARQTCKTAPVGRGKSKVRTANPNSKVQTPQKMLDEIRLATFAQSCERANDQMLQAALVNDRFFGHWDI
jgi:hypothetical protein